MRKSMKRDLSERDELVLDAIVNDYINSPEPVGSRTICRKHKLSLSPATIRNVASDLEEQGYLFQPHTSSGRVPTDKGFRLYVDKLLRLQKLTKSQKSKIESNYNLKNLDLKEILLETSKVLSKISNNVGLVLTPKLSMSIFEHIEFVKLSNNNILVVFVTKTGAVYNKKITVTEKFTQSDLHRISNYLSEITSGLSLIELRKKIYKEMKKEKIRCNRLFSRALNILKEMADYEETEAGIFVEGTSNIINDPVFKDISEVKKIMRALEDKALLVKILDMSILAEGTVAIIGEENNNKELSNLSVISSSYGTEDNVLGTLGVIGPRRIDYARVIPLVDYMSKLVSRLIEITARGGI
jgi:heat-inducible transcriptional repressor